MTTIVANGGSRKAHSTSRNGQITPRISSVQEPRNAVGKLLNGLFRTLAIWAERDRQRRQLAEMEPKLLSDIGVTPSQVSREIAKPFWVK